MLRRQDRVFVLPHTHSFPAGVGQQLIRLSIALTVPPDLLSPVRGVRLSNRVVVGAPVPETPIDEHCDLRTGKDEIRSSSHASNRTAVDVVPHAKRVNNPAQRELRACIAPSVPPHARLDASRGSPGFVLAHRLDASGAAAQGLSGSPLSMTP